VLGLGAVVLGVVLLGWLAERKMERKAAADSTSDIAQAHALKVALVLGTAPIGPEGGPNRYLVYRLDAAADLWKAGKVKYLLVSGNRDGSYDEPTAMRDGLIKRGVPAEAIYRDFAGYRTRAFGAARPRCVRSTGDPDTYRSASTSAARSSSPITRVSRPGVTNARDVDQPYSIVTPLRRYPSAADGLCRHVYLNRPASEGGAPVVIESTRRVDRHVAQLRHG